MMFGAFIVVFAMIMIISIIVNDGLGGKKKVEPKKEHVPFRVRKQYPKLSARIAQKNRKVEESKSS